MKIIVVYDSVFGNTGQIARVMGEALDSGNKVEVCNVARLTSENLMGTELLIVGSPTRGFRPTETISNFIKNLPPGVLTKTKISAIETRLSLKDLKSPITRFIVKKGGYAAKPMAEKLVAKGGILVLPPEGFFVTDEQGPLKQGETERAEIWAKAVLEKAST